MDTNQNSESATGRRGLKILYAEDVRELRDVARIALTRHGHSIECLEDGQLALERLAALDYAVDLLITDHHMPRLDGLHLVARLKSTPFAGRILVFSSELSPEIGAAYRGLGVDRVLYKPVFPSDLRRVLAEIFPERVPATPLAPA